MRWVAGTGVAALVIAAWSTLAVAQGSGGTAGGGQAGPNGPSGGQVQGSDGQDTPQRTGLGDANTRAGVAGTGMGTTTPAMRSDTSSTSGNGQSVQRPDPGTSAQPSSGSGAGKAP